MHMHVHQAGQHELVLQINHARVGRRRREPVLYLRNFPVLDHDG